MQMLGVDGPVCYVLLLSNNDVSCFILELNYFTYRMITENHDGEALSSDVLNYLIRLSCFTVIGSAVSEQQDQGCNQLRVDLLTALWSIFHFTEPFSTVAESARCIAAKKTHGNRRNISKLRKHLHQYDNMYCATTHNTANHTVRTDNNRYWWFYLVRLL